MTYIDPHRHPLLHLVCQDAQWVGQDDYPAFPEWAGEHERWLRHIKERGGFDHYLPRLQGPAPRRDEAFAEIGVAYFLERRCGLPVIAWEPRGPGGRKGDFLVALHPAGQMFVEVKSPGWEAEIAQAEGQASPRLSQPKYINAETRAIGPWAAMRYAVEKAYGQLPASMPTILITNDDYWIGLSGLPNAVKIALYCPRAPGHTTGYLAEDGCFVGRQYENLGAVGVLNVNLKDEAVEYPFTLYRNPNALPTVAVPETVFQDHPCYDGSEPA